MHIDGSCHCGAIRFTAEIDPARVAVCHCTDCQVMSGSAFRHVVPADIATFVLHGTPKAYVKVADSGNRRVQSFCGECGTPLYASAEDRPTWVGIRLGCVRQRAELPPRGQIWCASAMPWLDLLATLPGVPGQPAVLVPPAPRG